MPTVRINGFGSKHPTHPSFAGEYKPGDPEPAGYLDRQEWAEVQIKAGLKQVQCGLCNLWKFPQQLSGTILGQESYDFKGNLVVQEFPVCKECDK